jgi:hypothetical protein
VGDKKHAHIVAVHILGMFGTVIFWGASPRMPIGG